MYKILYPTLDATIYSQYPNRNTGVDQILELGKITEGAPSLVGDSSVYADATYNSRILIKFDLTDVQRLINLGKIDANTATYYLTLKATAAETLPLSYDIYAFPVSESWANGTGYFNNNPQVTNGVSWYYRSGKSIGNSWQTSSYVANTTGSFGIVRGGGTWYTSSYATQSFNHEAPDMRMNVTGIVRNWISGSISNQGFILKFSDSAETDSSIMGNIQFFSKETHTIYIPRLEIYWNDVDLSGISSFSEVSSDDFVISCKNLKYAYSETEVSKVRFYLRDRYTNVNYYSSSYQQFDSKRFPTSSYYQIQDVVSDDVVVPFDITGTRISCDSNGNYIKLDCNSLLPERRYKIVIKSDLDGGDTVKYTDNNFIFAIRRY